jgi:hypothetical protein
LPMESEAVSVIQSSITNIQSGNMRRKLLDSAARVTQDQSTDREEQKGVIRGE